MADENANNPEQGGAATLVPAARPAARKPKAKPLPRWHVVLLDDDEHTYEYVIRMLGRLFGHGRERARRLAAEVDLHGRAIVYTTHREVAELKREQVVCFGADVLATDSTGAMRAIIEPAE